MGEFALRSLAIYWNNCSSAALFAALYSSNYLLFFDKFWIVWFFAIVYFYRFWVVSVNLSDNTKFSSFKLNKFCYLSSFYFFKFLIWSFKYSDSFSILVCVDCSKVIFSSFAINSSCNLLIFYKASLYFVYLVLLVPYYVSSLSA